MSALLAVAMEYVWREMETLRSQLKHSEVLIRHTQHEIQQGELNLNEKKRRLELIHSAIDEARTRMKEDQLQKKDLEHSNGVIRKASFEIPVFLERLRALGERASWLDRQFKASPELNVPELQLLSESEWVSYALEPWEKMTPKQIREHLEGIRSSAVSNAHFKFGECLGKEKELSRLNSPSKVKNYLREIMGDDVMSEYEVLPKNGFGSEFLLSPLSPHLADNLSREDMWDFVLLRKHPVDLGHWLFYFLFDGERVWGMVGDYVEIPKRP